MKRWKKTVVWCMIPIVLYELIAFVSGWLIWFLLVQCGLFGSRIRIWTELNSGLLVTALAGAGAAVVFFCLYEKDLKKGKTLKKRDILRVEVPAVYACWLFQPAFF
ncbi:hypothetical protein [Clostridium sp. AM58-1XD]|uniref:hypothetical protein n=1 Tax=Clostridium sp. AM58-1XD TaxID=2292307 RepID=UPI000E4E8F12|nr:hypothetical protein [Clostridium sp. AM58-1XD]RGY98431.1 hypothetical protein DXA13_11585 [Clostridium sp. AM58-1XD]